MIKFHLIVPYIILYTGKCTPHFIFVPFAVVVSRQIYNLMNSNDRNYLSLNTTLSKRIYNGTKLLASEERQKMIRCKINFVYRNNAFIGKHLLQKQSTIVCVSDTLILLVRKSKYACNILFCPSNISWQTVCYRKFFTMVKLLTLNTVI